MNYRGGSLSPDGHGEDLSGIERLELEEAMGALNNTGWLNAPLLYGKSLDAAVALIVAQLPPGIDQHSSYAVKLLTALGFGALPTGGPEELRHQVLAQTSPRWRSSWRGNRSVDVFYTRQHEDLGIDAATPMFTTGPRLPDPRWGFVMRQSGVVGVVFLPGPVPRATGDELARAHLEAIYDGKGLVVSTTVPAEATS
ncbi:hypothetical protein [Streptomyces sp. XH2]|uniref:hypothetical protein n=1 Tax=Streptomyces sp. XH2 TaxID=3412483 RepID=UPI003C7B8869